MDFIYPIAGIWVALILGFCGYLGRKKKYGKLFQGLAIITASIAGILFLWWAAFRMLGID